MSKHVVLIFAALLFMFASSAFSATNEASKIAQTLKERINGNDAYLNKLLAPALSLDLSRSESDRAQIVNNQIAIEMDAVVGAFKAAAEDKKIDAVKQAANAIEPNLIRSNGAYITFTDKKPSAANSRMLVLIPKKNSSITTASVTNVLTSYKRSAKSSDYVYEYADAQNLTSGAIKTTVGSDNTWKLPNAAPAFALSQDYVVKKCRQLFGWRCVTSYYRADSFLNSADAFGSLFIAIVDLKQNPDHPEFARDKRSTNQIDGSTAMYIVKESANWVLIYGTDVQWSADSLSFTGVIQSEFQKDFNRFKERLAADLKISASDIK